MEKTQKAYLPRSKSANWSTFLIFITNWEFAEMPPGVGASERQCPPVSSDLQVHLTLTKLNMNRSSDGKQGVAFPRRCSVARSRAASAIRSIGGGTSSHHYASVWAEAGKAGRLWAAALQADCRDLNHPPAAELSWGDTAVVCAGLGKIGKGVKNMCSGPTKKGFRKVAFNNCLGATCC